MSFVKVTRFAGIFIAISVLLASCEKDEGLKLNVELGGRTVSKLPFVIAADQGLYEKYGLDVALKIPPPANPGGIRSNPGRPWKADIFVDGLTPNIVKQVQRARFPEYIAIASNDCIVRAHIIGQKSIDDISELKGKRIGISGRRDTTTGYTVLDLARRMGWDPDDDISIQFNGRNVEDLEDGLVDAIIASETRYAVAMTKGFPILADTEHWNEAVGGNSVLVTNQWLQTAGNREKAMLFLKATVEGLAIFHNDRELALDVMSRWYGIEDPSIANAIYDRGIWMPRKPFPCYAGTENTLQMYDSLEMRKRKPEDFYDDSLLRELDDSGFIDGFYE